MKLTIISATSDSTTLIFGDNVQYPINIGYQLALPPNKVTKTLTEAIFVEEALDTAVINAIDNYHHKYTGQSQPSGAFAIRKRMCQHIRDNFLVITPEELWEAYSNSDMKYYFLKEGNIRIDASTYEVTLANAPYTKVSMLCVNTNGQYFTSDNVTELDDVLKSMEV